MKSQQGFTLIEVLIAAIIFALGLLGLAGLQTSNIKNNMTAYYRGQAIQSIYDMSDRIRANKAATAITVYQTMSPTAAVSKATLCTPSTAPSSPTCTSANMAENDLWEWNKALKATLPSGTGTITFSTIAPILSTTLPIVSITTDRTVFTISVTWDSNHDNVVDANDPTFSSSFEL